MPTDTIQSFHAHVYFDSEQIDTARTVCERAAKTFGVEMGRMHDKPVGPHPMGSCQLKATPDQFAKLLPWLALNRSGLIVFAHPETGHDLEDHRDHGIWLGVGLDLDLSIF
jgi:DOPA 4,5-dioxygenase